MTKEFLTKLYKTRYAILPSGIGKFSMADVLLVCADTDRGYAWRGRSYSQLLDTLNELFGWKGVSTLTVALPYSREHGPRAFGSVMHLNGFFSRSAIKAEISKHICIFKSSVALKNTFIWRRVIEKVRPRIVIGIQPPMELCMAANEKNITIYDLQHGVLSDEGYYGLSYREKYNQKGWPNYILCWDEDSAAWVSRKTVDSIIPRVIGNPWMLRFIDRKNEDQLAQEALDEFEFFPCKNKILVTLSWACEQNGGSSDMGIPKGIVDAIKELDRSCVWLIRAHPAMMQSTARERIFQWLNAEFGKESNVEWEKTSAAPLPVILSQADIHLTSQSAATIEAELLGVKTGLLSSRKDLMHEYFYAQLKSGAAEIIGNSVNEIKSWIVANLNHSTERKLDINISLSKKLECFVQEVADLTIGRKSE